jgi:hypothetical protein
MKRGEKIPQTVGNLQTIMEADAVVMEQLGAEVASLKRMVAKQELTIAKLVKQRDQARAERVTVTGGVDASEAAEIAQQWVAGRRKRK